MSSLAHNTKDLLEEAFVSMIRKDILSNIRVSLVIEDGHLFAMLQWYNNGHLENIIDSNSIPCTEIVENALISVKNENV